MQKEYIRIDELISQLQALALIHPDAIVLLCEFAYGTSRLYPIESVISGGGITTCTSVITGDNPTVIIVSGSGK